jgi:hypothetical protein
VFSLPRHKGPSTHAVKVTAVFLSNDQQAILYGSVSQSGCRGTLGFLRTPFGVPREIVESIDYFEIPQRIVNIYRNIARIFVLQLETLE